MSALELEAPDKPASATAPEDQAADAALEAAWDAYARWDAAAISRKRRLDWSRVVIFILLIGAAVAGVLASQLKLTWVAGVAAACSAAAALLGREAVGPAVERLWLTARAATETLKSEAFKYAAGAAPYDDGDRGQRLVAAVSAIQADYISGITSNVTRDGIRPIPHTALNQAEYIRSRLENQTAWYESKAEFYNKHAWHWRAVSLSLGLIGAVISGVAAASNELTYLGAWVGVIGTLGGIVAAHLAGSRFSSLAQIYELTGRRLRHLHAEWDLVLAGQSSAKWSEFVLQCENTISTERDQWMQEWQRQITAATLAKTDSSSSENKPARV
jgi:hypothetical protein